MREAWPEALTAVVSNATFVVSWQVGLMVLGAFVTCGAWRLLGQRQRQATLREVLSRASAGTVVVYEDGPDGHSVRIWSSDQPDAPSPPSPPSRGSS
ncbi:hypothetical protein ABZ801_34830 [Actinomadura sp. NPDC047616]|uniref:hypothetical protein n=1 Tax=Actinomadura sp. NPDC047616 TaxID=3155914 RepID=UPI0033F5062A